MKAGGSAGSKCERVLAEAHSVLVGVRIGELAAIRKGMAELLGEDVLSVLTPEELACRLLGPLHAALGDGDGRPSIEVVFNPEVRHSQGDGP